MSIYELKTIIIKKDLLESIDNLYSSLSIEKSPYHSHIISMDYENEEFMDILFYELNEINLAYSFYVKEYSFVPNVSKSKVFKFVIILAEMKDRKTSFKKFETMCDIIAKEWTVKITTDIIDNEQEELDVCPHQ